MGGVPKKIIFAKNNVIMKKLKERFLKFWWYTFRNPIMREGEDGGMRWRFRRFWVDFETVSGNFKCRFEAGKDPYGYLLSSDDNQVHGFAMRLYLIGSLLTTDKQFVKDINRALNNLDKRLTKKAESGVVEDETEEKIALEEEKAVQEIVDMPKKEKRKFERNVNRRFKKAVREAEKHA